MNKDKDDMQLDKGLTEDVVKSISQYKDEPSWMLDIRLKAYNHFIDRPMPSWGNTHKLNSLDFDDICYFYVEGNTETEWDEVPE